MITVEFQIRRPDKALEKFKQARGRIVRREGIGIALVRSVDGNLLVFRTNDESRWLPACGPDF